MGQWIHHLITSIGFVIDEIGCQEFQPAVNSFFPCLLKFQVEGVRLFNEHDFYETVARNSSEKIIGNSGLSVFEAGERNQSKQAPHSLDAARMIEIDLKNCLLELTKELFGQSTFGLYLFQ